MARENKKVYKKEKEPAYPELADLKMSDGFKTNAVFFKLSFHFQITDYVSKILFPAFESIRILFIICFCRIFGCNRSIAIFDRLCGNDLAVTDKFNRICLLSACSSI